MDRLNRVEARIRAIQSLLGQLATTNEEFGRSLSAAAERRLSSSAPGLVPPERLQGVVAEAAARTGLSGELIAAVMAAESGCRPDAVSPAGAMGLMQLMPGTARALGVTDPFDARQNLLGGAEYLRQQVERFGSTERALAAYNAGPGAVERYGGIPPYPETRSYVQRIMRALRRVGTQ
jgi:soluble lytic murein transglycosylase-like protein